jgi:hypothetical protein
MKKSYNLEYIKTKECEILIFDDDLKFWSIFIKSIRNMQTLKKL